MNRYELGFIITPEANEEESKKIIDSILAIIKKSGGNVESMNEWGLKKMAYPIRKNTEGFYVFTVIEMPPDAVTAVEKRLRQIEKVIRFIVFRLDDKLAKSNKLVKKWKKMDHFSRKAREAAPKEVPEVEESSTAGNGEEVENASN